MSKPSSAPMRTSVRLSLQFSFLYALLSAVVFALAYWFTQYEVKDWVFDQMRGDVETLNEVLESDGEEGLLTKVDALAAVSFENTRIFQLVDANGEIVSGNIASPVTGSMPDFWDAESVALSSPLHDEVNGYWMREDQIGQFTLIQGSGDHIVGEILEALGTALIVGYLAVISLGLLVGIRVGRITEERIVGISDALTKAAKGQLNVRIPANALAADDLSRVSTEINQMLDQIQRLVESQQQISNDIAHDMRTPLQRLRQRLETLRDSKHVAQSDVVACLEQTEEIVQTFNALLRISEIESDTRDVRFKPVDLQYIVHDVAETFDPLAEDAGKSLRVNLDASVSAVRGDKQLLTQLLVNLVDNAIKHSGDGKNVIIGLEPRQAGPVLFVSDDGPGIDPALHEKIFRRFYRAEESRHSPGNGLGLAIVSAIAKLHGARILIEPQKAGSKFCVVFGQEANAGKLS